MYAISKIKRKLLIFYWSILGLRYQINNFKEIKNQKKIKNYKYILGVYDYGSFQSPYSIGDFLCYLFFYKSFYSHKKKIDFLIIVEKNKLNNFKKKILKIQISMTRFFLSKYLHKIKVCSWSEFLKGNYNDYYIPYKNDVFLRKDLRLCFVSMYNKILKNSNSKILKEFLIKKNDFNFYKRKFCKKYITWHIRYNPGWSQLRNIKINEFLEVYKILKKKIKKTPIVIISDEQGCNFAKKIKKKEKLDLIFCKDISKSIFSDFNLIMNSKLFFCFKAGGVLVIPWFSKLSFVWGGTIGLKNQYISGRSISISKLFFWQTKNQIWINSNSFEYFKEKVKEIDFKRFGI